MLVTLSQNKKSGEKCGKKVVLRVVRLAILPILRVLEWSNQKMVKTKFDPCIIILILAKFGECSFKNVAARGWEVICTKSHNKKTAIYHPLFNLPTQFLCFLIA